MASLFLKQKWLFCKTYTLFGTVVLMLTNRLSSISVSEIRQDRSFYRNPRISDARTTETWKMDDFLQKLKKVVRIMLYGPAISQSDCRKAGPYQLPYKIYKRTSHQWPSCANWFLKYWGSNSQRWTSPVSWFQAQFSFKWGPVWRHSCTTEKQWKNKSAI